MLAVITMVSTADDKKQLDSDTETVLAVARKHMCQLAVLKFQQFDGLNTSFKEASANVASYVKGLSNSITK